MKKYIILLLVFFLFVNASAQIDGDVDNLKPGDQRTYTFGGTCFICEFQWTVPSGVTNLSGTTTARDITLRFNTEGNPHVLRLQVTDGGTSSNYTKNIYVCAQITLPTVSDVSRCGDGEVQFDPSGSTGKYYWYSSYNSTTPLTTNLAQGILVGDNGTFLRLTNLKKDETYYVSGVNGCGQISQKIQANADHIPLPSINVNGSLEICPGGSTSISLDGADSYSWSPTTGLSNPNVNWSSVTASPTTDTQYTVTGTKDGCSAAISFLVDVLTPPTVGITASATTVCSGQSVSLTATGASTYKWAHNNSTNSTISVTPSVPSTTYTVTGKDTKGCPTTKSITIYANSLPSVGISTSSTRICSGEAVTLTGTGANSYSWSGSEGTTSSENQITVVLHDNATFTVTGEDLNNCRNTYSVDINVDNTPVLEVSPPITICRLESTVLTASGATTYEWSPSDYLDTSTGNSVVANPPTTTTYTVTGKTGDCESVKTVKVTVNQLEPTPIINDITQCGGTVKLLIEGEVEDAITEDYKWYYEQEGGIPFQEIGNFVELTSSAEIWVEKTGDCPSPRDRAIVTIGTPPLKPNDIENFRCGSGEITLDVPNPDGDYVWFDPNGIEIEESLETYELLGIGNSSLRILNLQETATFSVKKSSEGCPLSPPATALALIQDLPQVSAGPDLTVCQSVIPIILDDDSQVPPLQGDWSGEHVSGNQFTPVAAGDFNVTYSYTDNNNCLNSDTRVIRVLQDPSAGYINGPSQLEECDFAMVTLQLLEYTEGDIQWQFKEGDMTEYMDVPSSVISPEDIYTIDFNVTLPNTSFKVILTSGLCGEVETPIKNVSLSNPPDLPAVTSPQICEPGEMVFTITNYDPVYTYEWLYDGQPLGAIQSGSFDLLPSDPDNLRVMANETDELSFEVRAVDSPCESDYTTVTGTVGTGAVDITANGSLEFCEGGNVRLSVLSEEQYEWQWFKNDQEIDQETKPFLDVESSGIYKVQASLPDCEFFSEPVEVTVNGLPDAPTSGIDGFRFGPGLVTLSASGSAPSFSWYSSADPDPRHVGATYSPDIVVGTETFEVLSIIPSTGCESEESITVSATAYEIPQITIHGQPSISPGDSVLISVGPDTYDLTLWSVSDNLYATNNPFYAKAPGNYRLIVQKSGVRIQLETELGNRLLEQNRNYIITTNVRESNVKNENLVDLLTLSGRSISSTYFDGLGRQVQNVDLKQSPNYSDLVTQTFYDLNGRSSESWIPYADVENSGWYKENATTTALAFYNNSSTPIPSDPNPFSKTIYESSPSNRPVDQGAPGQTWQPGSGHSVRTSYGTNQKGVVKWWRLNEYGYPVYDLSVPTGSIPTQEGLPEEEPPEPEPAPEVSEGLIFDGIDDYIALDFSFAAFEAIPQMTVEAWVKTDVSGLGEMDNMSILDFDETQYFGVYVSGSDGKVVFGTNSFGQRHKSYSNTSVNDDQWHHVAVVFNNSSKDIYIDGVLDSSEANPHTFGFIGFGMARFGMIGDGSLAGAFNGNRSEKYFEGELKEVKYWERDLSASEIVESFNGTLTSTSLLELHYDFSEITGNTLSDLELPASDGTLFNFSGQIGTETPGGFVLSNELIFDGLDDYVALDMNYDPSNKISALTVEAWVNTSVSGEPKIENWSIVDFDKSDFYNLYVHGTNGKVVFSTSNGTAHELISAVAVNDGIWHHVAAVYDGVEKKIYIDGILDVSIPNPHTSSELGSTRVRYGYLGDGSESASFDAGRNMKYFDGKLSEVRIWEVARTEEEIADHYMMQLSGSEAGLKAYYTFTQGGTDQLVDRTGNGHHGTLRNMDLSQSWSDEGPDIPGYYPGKQLYLTQVTDENGVITQEFKDRHDQTAMKRTQLDSEWVETHYIYNAYNQLVMVIQPEGIQRYDLEFNPDPERFLDNWTFQYRYDDRGRVSQKKVPGKGWEYFVYDQRDRLVLSQDANLRSGEEWLYTKYDHLNRPIVTGRKIISGSRDTVQEEVDQYYIDNPDSYSENLSSDVIFGYTNNAYPLADTSEVLTITYYDNYDFLSSSEWLQDQALFQFYSYPDPNLEYFPRVTGQVTGEIIRVLPSGSKLRAINYYDDKYRIIQTTKENQFGIPDFDLTCFDFEGKILRTTYFHHGREGTILINNDFKYDHTGRLIKNDQWFDTNETLKLTLLENQYDELGELMSQGLHSRNGSTPLQTCDYRYNIRGWLSSMNDAELVDQSDWFGMEIHYDDNPNGGIDRFNGNISAIQWSKRGPGEVSQPRLYSYAYDDLNRINSASYSRMFNGGWNAEKTYYNVSGIGYDHNGNIISLARKGYFDGIEEFDNLGYQYNDGNQLMAVSDMSGNVGGFDDGSGGDDYSYDANGNMISDLNKGISSISYNHLNLPQRVDFSGGNYLEFTYDAEGNKLKQTSFDGTNSEVRRYSGEFIYRQDKIEEIQNEVGRTLPRRDGNDQIVGYEYQYHMKDHLGNVRLTFSEDTYRTEDTFLATMETENADDESMFSNVEETRHLFLAANHTPNGNEASRLNAAEDRIIGPALSFAVLPGDTINLEVYAYYEQGTGNNGAVVANTLLASTLAGTFGYTGGQETQFISDFFNDASSGIAAIGSGNSDIPRAYLNYILFDEEYALVDFGFTQVSEAAKNNPDLEYISIQNIIPSQEGYIYIYVSNESDLDVNVWFDDLQITHINHSHIVQMDDYYPFGLGIDALSYRRGGVENRWLFNGGNEFSTELVSYQSRHRIYDQNVGRFTSIDKFSDLFVTQSPQVFGYNNPNKFIDPLGLFGQGGDDRKKKKRKKEGKTDEPAWTVHLANVTVVGSQHDHTYEYLYNSFNPIERGIGLAFRRGERQWLKSAFNRSNQTIEWRGFKGQTEFGDRFYSTIGDVFTYGIGGAMIVTYGAPILINTAAESIPLAKAIGSGINSVSWKLGGVYNYSNLIASQGARTLAYNMAYYGRPVLLGSTGKYGVKTFVELIHFSKKGDVDLFKTGKTIYDIISTAKKIVNSPH